MSRAGLSRAFAAAFGAGACLLSSLAGAAEPMLRSDIIELGRPAIGHAYHWGHGDWTKDGTNIGSCMPTTPGSGCPKCTPVGDFGADCSGFVAKAWQVPEPSAVEAEGHPFSTEAFSREGTYWDVLPDFTDIRQGDAFSYSQTTVKADGTSSRSGHIMLVERVLANSRYEFMHAAGCGPGIIRETKVLPSGKPWVAIRRNQLTDEVCTPDSCSNHGTCQADSTCACDLGFAGDHCERCMDGYAGYPNCIQTNCPAVRGNFSCGKSVDVILGDENKIETYGCGAEDYLGGEVGYRFAPPGAGTATIRMNTSDNVAMMLLRNECSPDSACAGTSNSELTFEYGGGDGYYVIFENLAPTSPSAPVKVTIECQSTPDPWIGSPCSDDAGCSNVPAGRCYKSSGQSEGFCTTKCTKGTSKYTCPDRPNVASTFCVADPADASVDLCVAKSDRLNEACASVPGTGAETATRFKGTDSAQVCMPGASACASAFAGQVVDAASESPITDAVIAFTSDAKSGSVTPQADGTFKSEQLACGQYRLEVEAAGYLPASVAIELTANQSTHQVVALKAIPEDCAMTDLALSGVVQNGSDDSPLAGATVELHEGLDAPNGPVVDSQVTNASGAYEFATVPGGYYTLVASADGFTTGTGTPISLCGGISQAAPTLYLLPNGGLAGEGAVFVLNWSFPDDLDLHLQLPSGEEIFFGECAGDLTKYPNAHLDIDHQKADGPESITILKFEPGTYTLFVHNFSGQNEAASTQWGDTGAVIEVYDGLGVPVRRINAPVGSGFFWDVLTFEGSDKPVKLDVRNVIRQDRANVYDEYTQACQP